MKLQTPPILDTPFLGVAARRAYLMMLGSAVSFAAMTACARAAGQSCGDWRITAVARGAIVLLFAAVIARWNGVPLVWRASRTLWVRSLAGSVAMLLTFFALTHHENISTALTLTNTSPLWVTLLAWPLLGQRPTAAAAIALLSGVIGVALIERPDLGAFRWTSAAALAAAACTAIVMLGLHRLKNVDALAIVVHFSAVATVVCTTFAIATALYGKRVDLTPLLAPVNLTLLAGIGVFATTGQILMTQAFRSAAPQRLAVIGLTQVVFALGFDYIFWHTTIHGWALLGIGLVIAPVAWLLLRRPR